MFGSANTAAPSQLPFASSAKSNLTKLLNRHNKNLDRVMTTSETISDVANIESGQKRQSNEVHNSIPCWLYRELRSDQAGEAGAVAIYQGILAVSRNEDVRRFAKAHLETEKRHLKVINGLCPDSQQSMLVPLWRICGFLTGAIPAAFGAKAVFVTIDAVETFVDRHYMKQIGRLASEPSLREVREILESCHADELNHRDEARALHKHRIGSIPRAWQRIIGAGSALAVLIARRI